MSDTFAQIEQLEPPVPADQTQPRYVTATPPGQGKLFALILPQYRPETNLRWKQRGVDDPSTDGIDETYNNPREEWPEQRRKTLVNMGSHRVALSGVPILFDASLSYDGEGKMARNARWEFGDGTDGHGLRIEHVYQEPGEYTVRCDVNDGHARRFVRVLDAFGESDMDVIAVDGWEGSLDVGWTIKMTVASAIAPERLQGILLYTDDALDTSWRGKWDKQFLKLGKRYAYTGRAPSQPDWQTITVSTTTPVNIGVNTQTAVSTPYESMEEGFMPVGTIDSPEWERTNNWDRIFYDIGNEYGVHPNLLKAIVRVRSNGNPNLKIKHPKDENALVQDYTTYGLAQMTCKVDTGQYGYCNSGGNLLDPEKNIERLCQSLTQHYKSCGGWTGALYKFHSYTCLASEGYDSADRSTNVQFATQVLQYWEDLDIAVAEQELADLYNNANDVVFSGYILDAVESAHSGDGIRKRWDLTVVDVSQALDQLSQREEKFYEEELEDIGGGTIMGRPMRASHIVHHTLQEHINYDRRHDIVIDYSGPRMSSTVTSEGSVLGAFRAIAGNEFANVWGDSQGRLHYRQRASYRGMGGWFKEARKLTIYVEPSHIIEVKVDDRLQGDFTSWVQLKGWMSVGNCALVAEYPCSGQPARNAGLWDMVSGLQIDDWKTLCRLAAQHYAHLNRDYDVELLMYWRHDLELGDLIYLPLRDPSGVFNWATSETYEGDPFFVITEMGHQYDVTNATWLTRIKAQQVTYLRRCECPKPICTETIYDKQEPDEMPDPPKPLPASEVWEPGMIHWPPSEEEFFPPPDITCADLVRDGYLNDEGECVAGTVCNGYIDGGKIDELIASDEALTGIASPLKAYGWQIVQLGLEYGIHPGVVAAIIQQTTLMGTDGSVFTLNNNFGGVKGVGTCGSFSYAGTFYAKYCTVQDGLYGLYEVLHSSLYRESGGTLADVLAISDPIWSDNPAVMWEQFSNIGIALGIELLPETPVYGNWNCEGDNQAYQGCQGIDLSDGGFGTTDPDTGDQAGFIRDTTDPALGTGWETSKNDDQKNVMSAITEGSSGYVNVNETQTPENDYRVTGNLRTRVTGQFRFPAGVAGYNAWFRIEAEPWVTSSRPGPGVTIYAADHAVARSQGIGAKLTTETSVVSDNPIYPAHPICPWAPGQENNGTLNFHGRAASLDDWHTFEVFFDEGEQPQRTYLNIDSYTEYVEDTWYTANTCNLIAGHPGELCGTVHAEGHRIRFSFGADAGYQGEPGETTMGNPSGFGSMGAPFGIAQGPGMLAWVVDNANGRINEYNLSTGTFIRIVYQATGADNLFGLAYLGGKLFVSAGSGRTIRRINPDSGIVELTWTTSAQTFDTLRLRAGPDGYLYAMNEIANNIQVWDTEGNPIRQIVGFFGGPRDAAWDSLGNIYVTDTEAAKIKVFSPGGQFLREWGILGTGQCQLQLPTSIAIAGDTVFVIDVRPVKSPSSTTGISKVVKFTLQGECIDEWRPPRGSIFGSSPYADWEPTDMVIVGNTIYVTDGYGFGGGNDQVTTIGAGVGREPSDVLGQIQGVFVGSAETTEPDGSVTSDPTCQRNPGYRPGYTGTSAV